MVQKNSEEEIMRIEPYLFFNGRGRQHERIWGF
jgi:hypothetical protein